MLTGGGSASTPHACTPSILTRVNTTLNTALIYLAPPMNGTKQIRGTMSGVPLKLDAGGHERHIKCPGLSPVFTTLIDSNDYGLELGDGNCEDRPIVSGLPEQQGQKQTETVQGRFS